MLTVQRAVQQRWMHGEKMCVYRALHRAAAAGGEAVA